MLDERGGGGIGTPWNRLKRESSGLPPPCPSISRHPPPFFTISFLYTSAAGSTWSKHVAPHLIRGWYATAEPVHADAALPAMLGHTMRTVRETDTTGMADG
jgi:hypothetical protein